MNDKLTRLLVIVTALLLVCFWSAYVASLRLVAIKRIELADTQRPFLINGLRLTLDQATTPPLMPTASTGRYLVLVSSDTCPYSRQEQQNWGTLLRTLPLTAADVVVFVTFDGDAIPRALAPLLNERGIPYQFLHVTNRMGFIETTGIASTPKVLALDSRLILRSMPRRDSDKGMQHLAGVFSERPLQTNEEGPL